ncbi:GSCOCG00011808001-RA-CDS, partial [Cotesia congregata]
MSNTQLPKQVATQSSGASKLAAESDNEKTPLSTGDKQQLDNLPPESKSTEMSPIVKPTPESGKSNDVESLKDPNTSGGVTESDKKENAPEKLDVEIIEILGEDPLAEDPQVGVLHSE